jgi:choline-sulfatase
MKGLEFKSVMPMVRDADKSQYESVYGAFGMKEQRAVIDGDHKMILYPATGTILLFDLSKDPLEMNDLAGKPESATLEKRLFARLRELQRQTGDQLDLTRSYPKLAE